MKKRSYYPEHPVLPFDDWSEPVAERKRGTSATSDITIGKDEVNMADDKLIYMSFGSGSSGNSCYIGTEDMGIIVDAGVRADKILEMMADAGIPVRNVKALLLTHDHSDHVRFAYNLLRTQRNMSLYCTPRVLNGVLRRHNISKRIRDYHTPIFKEIPFKIGKIEITAFEVPHDGSDNMGFFIEYAGHKFALATDLGSISDRARHYLSQANYMVIEANYDSDMLRLGRYPEYLKARIRASNGHLDNEDTAGFLTEVINPELQYVFLCHLSQDNNTPAKALKCVRDRLESIGKRIGTGEDPLTGVRSDVHVIALPRFEASRKFIFRKI